MERSQKELALYIINLKIAKEINENTEKSYNKLKQKIKNLKLEKQEIYMDNQEVMNKVLTEYLKDVKKGE